MNRKIIISPSIMCCTPAEMEPFLRRFEECGIDTIHFDIMDGHYVPNVMLGVRDYQFIKRTTNLPVDVHMMCTEPEMFLEYFKPQPGDWVSFHPETARNPYRLLQAIRDRGCKAGIALSPAVPVAYVEEMASVLDFVLVMAVNPGFAGQKMVPDHLDKLRRIHEAVVRTGRDIDIIIDGNTIVENARAMIAAGATGLVVGTSSLLKGGPDRFAENYRTYTAAIAAE